MRSLVGALRLDALRPRNRISPTAHYTGHTWVHHGMSDPALDTPTGRLLFGGLWPLERTLSLVGAPTVEGFLISRHRVIDAYLDEAINDGSITQIVEVACGLSPRGLTFHRRYGNRITYIEADLPEMGALKRERLERAGDTLGDAHRVVEVDVLADDGPESIAALLASLDPDAGTAVITEGLINYFDQRTAEGIFRRIASGLSGFRKGLYLTDLYLTSDNRNPLSGIFGAALGVFVRSRVYTFYSSPQEATTALLEAGFDDADIMLAASHPAAGDMTDDPGAALVRVVRATTG